jgi:predicted alpha/beta superfamily hydrolase
MLRRLLKFVFRKKTLYIIFGAFLSLIAFRFGKDAYKEYQWIKYVESLEDTASSNVSVLKDTVYIDYLDEKRTLRIYLPSSYSTDTIHYPVIYFFDGNSLFSDKTLEGPEWRVDEVIDSIAAINGEAAIVIGIDNSDNRMTEYKPFLSPYIPEEKEVTGDKHVKWLATDLKQWVDQNYRTKKEAQHTTIGGASLGGLMAYYTLTQYSNIFGKAIIFSPSFWVNKKVFELHHSIVNIDNIKIYMNIGEYEGGEMIPNAKKILSLLKDRGIASKNLRFDIVRDEGHDHTTWRIGFQKAYPWIIQP